MFLELALLLLGIVADFAISVADVEGVPRQPLRAAKGRETALFFVTADCPISNGYAREIGRICSGYGPKGLDCALVYVDPSLSDAQARAHAAEYGLGGYPKFVDRGGDLVKAAGATVTPEVALIDSEGRLVYRGRIDDSYASLGQSRRLAKNVDLRNALDASLAGRPVAVPETKPLGCYIPRLPAR